MNRDPEDIQRHLLRLLQDLFPAASPTDIEAASRALGREAGEARPNLPTDTPQRDSADPLATGSGADSAWQRDPAFNFGDVPAVQDRFHALLKQRLQSEIQQHPPLFPWESELQDYEASPSGIGEAIAPGGALPWRVWMRQLAALELPVAVPEAVLAQVLAQCQAVAQSSLREGSKLVKAVESLFPEQEQSLNYLAGLVMAAPARSDSLTAQPPASANFPANYEAAIPAQQMVLTLLAARKILDSLTLTVSPQTPVAEQHWETNVGPVGVVVRYEGGDRGGCLRAHVTCPTGGTVTLPHPEGDAMARRTTPGLVGVELPAVVPPCSYPLVVSLADQADPLTFTVHIRQS